MDLITKSLLDEFSTEQEIASLPEDTRFEHFASYVTVRRQYGETFDPADIVVGKGNDTGIDAIAVILNGTLITDIETLEDKMENCDCLDVVFVFVQAERTEGFDASKIGNFTFGVGDFFKTTPVLPRNDGIKESAAMAMAIYGKASKFKRGKPQCKLYYVTTGRWTGDATLEGRRSSAIADLEATQLFSSVEFTPVDADQVHKLYRQSKNAFSREFVFSARTEIPEIPGITQAYLGLIPFNQFRSIISDDDGDMLHSIFYDNVRDWQGYNPVNSEIRETLQSDHKSRFVLMNNGVTIIARSLVATASRFTIEDFQIVNGCQTSHVLFDQRDSIDDSVMIPLRLIATSNEDVIESIIRATNRQTEIKKEQFLAVTDFPKKLEAFFQAQPEGQKLFYERRSRQYDSLSVERTRIITPANMIRAFAAMFLSEPHRTTRSYRALTEKVGTEIFGESHRLEPYYTAAAALYKLEFAFRAARIDAKYKPARFHILLAMRLIANHDNLPRMNAHDIQKYCANITGKLWDSSSSDELCATAASIVEEVAKESFGAEAMFHRDNIRTQPFTEKVIARCKEKVTGH